MNFMDPLPKGIKLLQISLSCAVGLFAMILWRQGIAGFIAFILSFMFVYVGIAVIYLQSHSEK